MHGKVKWQMTQLIERFSMKTLKHNHALLMLIACAVPLILLLFLSWTGILAGWGYFLLILLCPLMHIFMHKGIQSVNQNPDDPKP